MRAFRVKTLLPLVVALCLGAAGCGGGDESSSSSASSEELPARELISRADGICRKGVERFAEIQSRTPSSANEAGAQTADLVEVASGELDELRALSPPEDLARPYEAYLESRATALDQLERGRDAAADDDSAAYVEARNEANAGQPQRLKLAKAVGLKSCSQPGAAPKK
jgi:hypothetical protein